MKIKDTHVLYINLKEDTEKKKRIEHQLDSLKLKYTRIDAVRGSDLKKITYRRKVSKLLDIPMSKLTVKYWTDRKNFKTMCNCNNKILNKVGCYLSHMLAMIVAKQQKLKAVVILEDDADFQNNYNNEITVPKNTDMIYLGGSFFENEKNIPMYRAKVIKINTDTFKIAGTFGYIIPNKKTIEDIINVTKSVFLTGKAKDKHDEWRSGKIRLRAQAMDFMYINFFQKYGNCYLVNPVMISHKELGSNITNNRQKYKIRHFLFESQSKKIRSLFK